MEYIKKGYFFQIIQNSPVNISRIIWIWNANFSEYYFKRQRPYRGDFKICISVPLKEMEGKKR